MLTLSVLPLLAILVAETGIEHRAVSVFSPRPIWHAGIGEGFARNARAVDLKLGRAFGTTQTGSNHSHDLTLAQIEFGWMLTDVLEPDYWFGGNLEGIGRLLAGIQDNPEGAYYFGLNAGFRYHFRTHTPIDPFLAGTFGVGITDIGNPDATGKLQFNQQIGAGARYFLTNQHALTLEYAYWHISNGGIREPNDGVNAHIISLGFAWLF